MEVQKCVKAVISVALDEIEKEMDNKYKGEKNMKRKIYAIILTLMMATMMLSACGKDVSKMDDAELYAYLMDMDEDEREDFIETLDDEQQYRAYSVLIVEEFTSAVVESNEQDADVKEEEKETTSNKKVKYEPTEEIINSTLADGKIQIGNSVFRNGGFLTLGEFVETYSDEFVSDSLNLDKFGGNDQRLFTSKNDSDMKIRVSYKLPLDVEDTAHVKNADLIVYEVIPFTDAARDVTWLPKGLPGRNSGLTWENYTDYYEENGLTYNDHAYESEGYCDYEGYHYAHGYINETGMLGQMEYRVDMEENRSTGEIENIYIYAYMPR